MAVVVGVTVHLSPCRRCAADEGSFSNLGGPTQVAESSCRAQPHIRVLGRRYHRLGYPSHTTRASRSGFSNCGPPVRHRPGDWTKVDYEAVADWLSVLALRRGRQVPALI